MKRLIAVLLAFITLNAFSEAILWMVDETMYSGAFTAARVMVSPSGDGKDAEVLSTLMYNDDTGGYTDVFSDGIGIINSEDYNPASTGEMWSEIRGGLDYTTAKFYIELGNYSMSGDDLTWTGTVATGDMVTYDWLRNSNHSLGTAGDFVEVFNPWNGMNYTPGPEPTSGMLMLVGLALLSLRRRKPKQG